MKIYLIRHGETDWNLSETIQGSSDIEINSTGESQANKVTDDLKLLDIDRIVSSDLKRAMQTATIVAKTLNIPTQSDARLRECDFGEYEGMTWDEVESKYNKKKSDYFTGDGFYDFTSVKGEDKNSVKKRHFDLLEELKGAFPDETILLVGHGTGLNTLLSVLGYPIGLQRGEIRELDY